MGATDMLTHKKVKFLRLAKDMWFMFQRRKKKLVTTVIKIIKLIKEKYFWRFIWLLLWSLGIFWWSQRWKYCSQKSLCFTIVILKTSFLRKLIWGNWFWNPQAITAYIKPGFQRCKQQLFTDQSKLKIWGQEDWDELPSERNCLAIFSCWCKVKKSHIKHILF